VTHMGMHNCPLGKSVAKSVADSRLMSRLECTQQFAVISLSAKTLFKKVQSTPSNRVCQKSDESLMEAYVV
jgi:hypothetical protein